MKGGCISGDRVVSGEWTWLQYLEFRGSRLIDASIERSVLLITKQHVQCRAGR